MNIACPTFRFYRGMTAILSFMLTMYVGDSDDIRRTVAGTPAADHESAGFGSERTSGCNVAVGDGSVRFVLMTDQLQP